MQTLELKYCDYCNNLFGEEYSDDGNTVKNKNDDLVVSSNDDGEVIEYRISDPSGLSVGYSICNNCMDRFWSNNKIILTYYKCPPDSVGEVPYDIIRQMGETVDYKIGASKGDYYSMSRRMISLNIPIYQIRYCHQYNMAASIIQRRWKTMKINQERLTLLYLIIKTYNLPLDIYTHTKPFIIRL